MISLPPFALILSLMESRPIIVSSPSVPSHKVWGTEHTMLSAHTSVTGSCVGYNDEAENRIIIANKTLPIEINALYYQIIL